MKNIVVSLVFLVFIACKKDALPKPKAFLSLEYPRKHYISTSENLPYLFEYDQQAKIIKQKNNWIDIYYPNLKATLNITYHPVKGNLTNLISDAEKLTFKHTIKADNIEVFPYENKYTKVYVRLFEIYGDAASALQFQATDSTKHFINGSLYFDARPNYDSILPAVEYLKKDIKHFVETLHWKS